MDTLVDDNGCVLKRSKVTLDSPFQENVMHAIHRQHFIREFGRDVAWVGNKGVDYFYSRKHHACDGYPPVLRELTELVRQRFDVWNREKYCNHLLINRYSVNQRITAHKDDEAELVAPIISVSFGAPATFRFSRNYNACATWEDRKNATNIILEHGDLLIGNRAFFNQFYHCTSFPTGGQRINLTWRTVR